MAKRNKSNIQRRNLPKQSNIGHAKIKNTTRRAADPEPKYENTYFFTMVGMFAGMLIGWLFDLMMLGFGIGIVIGGIIDYILSEKRKKQILSQQEETSE